MIDLRKIKPGALIVSSKEVITRCGKTVDAKQGFMFLKWEIETKDRQVSALKAKRRRYNRTATSTNIYMQILVGYKIFWILVGSYGESRIPTDLKDTAYLVYWLSKLKD